jgi:guanine nucleotide-binding protein G(i) subunit alpha
MKIIHQNGYTTEELLMYRLTIYKNVLDCAKALIGAMRQFGIAIENVEIRELADFLMEYQISPDPQTTLDPRVGDAVVALWQDQGAQEALEHQSEFYLMDSAP